MNIRQSVLVLLIALPLSVQPVVGQDGLYAPSRPDDAALVRIVHVGASGPSPVVDVGPVRFEPRPAKTGSAYQTVPIGVYVLGGGNGAYFTPEPQSFVTIVAGFDPDDPEALQLFRDIAHDDPARAQLVLYNLTAGPVSLVATRPESEIFTGVQSGGTETVVVNAMEVELKVLRDDGTVVDRDTVMLPRGGSYAIFVATGVDGDHLVGVQATVADQ